VQHAWMARRALPVVINADLSAAGDQLG